MLPTVTKEEHTAPPCTIASQRLPHPLEATKPSDRCEPGIERFITSGIALYHNAKLEGCSFLEFKGLDWYLKADAVGRVTCQF